MRTYHNDLTIRIDYNPTTALDPVDRIGVGPRSKTVLDVYDDDHSDDDTIYVSPLGDDGDPGTYAEPMLTIAAAILACDGVRDKVIAYSATAHVFIEDYTDIVDDYCTGIFAHEDSEEVSVVVMDATTYAEFLGHYNDDEFIFVAGTEGSDTTGDGSELTPYATIGKAKTEGDASGADCWICILNSETYEEPGLEFDDDVKGIWAWPGETPVWVATVSEDSVDVPTNVVSTKTFNAGNTTRTASAITSNGDIITFFRDEADSGKGKYIVHDDAGTVVYAEQTFNNASTDFPTCISMVDGNVMCVYRDVGDGNKLKNVVVDGGGAIAYGPTTINANACFPYRSLGQFASGNIAISHGDAGDSRGKLAVVDSEGTVVLAPVSFSAAAALSGGSAVISGTLVVSAYRDEGNSNKGTVVITGEDGTESVAPAVFNDAATSAISVADFGNDTAIITFKDEGDSNKGKYIIIDSTGSVVFLEAAFSAAGIYDAYSAIDENGFCNISYIDSSDSDKGKCTGILPSGAVYYSPYVFLNSACSVISLACIKSVGCYFAFKDTSDNYGKFLIDTPPTFRAITAVVSAAICGLKITQNYENLLLAIIVSDSASIDVAYCEIYNAVNGSGSGALSISGDDSTTVQNCIIRDNDNGIHAATSTGVIKWNEFRGNTGTAIHTDGAGVGIEIEHNTIFNNGAGILLENNDGNEVVKNNVIHANSGYAIEADTEIETTYSDITGSVLNVVKTNCVSGNPLFVDETNDDLHLMDILGGNPATSPAKNLADDSDPDRNAGCYDTIYIGEGEVWETETILKPKEIPIEKVPIGATRNEAADGTPYTSVDGFLERVKWQWDAMENDDLAAIDRICECMNPRLRIYPDEETNPLDFDLYTLVYGTYSRSPKKNFRLSRTGVSGVSMIVERKKV